MTIFHPIAATLFVLTSILFINLGFDWIEGDCGLHPLIAFPLSIICILCAGVVMFAPDPLVKDMDDCEEEI